RRRVRRSRPRPRPRPRRHGLRSPPVPAAAPLGSRRGTPPWPNSPSRRRRRRPCPCKARRRPSWRALRARRRPPHPEADCRPRRAVTANAAASATDPRARQGRGLRPPAEGVRPPERAARRAVVEGGGGRGARKAVVAVCRRRGGEHQPTAAGANAETAVVQRRRPADTARCETPRAIAVGRGEWVGVPQQCRQGAPAGGAATPPRAGRLAHGPRPFRPAAARRGSSRRLLLVPVAPAAHRKELPQ
ncbi:unnamed protein product, partial [Ectocarpus sp. 4 AP-2014]